MNQINATTTAIELLTKGASIIGRQGQTLNELLRVSPKDDTWMHDLSVATMLERGAAITLMNGLGIVKIKDRLVMFEEQYEEIHTLRDYPEGDLGLESILDDLESYSETEGVAVAA